MKKFEIQDFLPVGIDFWKTEARYVLGGLIVSAVWSLITPFHYFQERQHLLMLLQKTGKIVYMSPFSELATPGLALFQFYFFAMVLLGFTHMQFHRKRSMSIYLMKRLPNPKEYWIRCWGIPVLAGIAALAEMGLLFGLYYLVYLKFTPIQCLLSMYLS